MCGLRLLILASIFYANTVIADCYKITGHVFSSTPAYVDVAYQESVLRVHHKKAERKNILPKGVSLVAYLEFSNDSKYVTDYDSIDITRRSVASSSELLEKSSLTKDGKCLREFK